MATDLEKLVVQLSADIKGYQNELNKANGVTQRQARAIENRFRAMNKNLDSIGKSAANALIAPLTGIAAALSVREVAQYADAWTQAKNSLAVAGVVGQQQADVLDKIFQSAQANATPINALASLYGKAAQSADNLGASQEDLLKFSDGVAVALRVAGTGASEASGALTQLSQLLGSARVQAEEFNSVNEGARPILIAVANGLDAAGGSVNKLKQLVNDGKLTGQQFFQAFLKGLPTIQAMAANATQTIDQGLTKVNNAFTKYIGQTDESLSASQRLVGGLNALANNFDATADIVLKVASIIAGALVGRSIAGMIAKLGLATTVVTRFVAALRAATTVGGVATAIGGLSAAAGPIGLLIGGTVVGALALFASSSEKASVGARTYADALKQVEAAANAAAPAIRNASQAQNAQQTNALSSGVSTGVQAISDARQAAVDLFSTILDNAPRRLISEEQLGSLQELRDGLKSGAVSATDAKDQLFALANGNANFQKLANQMEPLLDALSKAIEATGVLSSRLSSLQGPEFRQDNGATIAAYDKIVAQGRAFVDEATRRAGLTKDQLALENEILEVRKEALAAGAQISDEQINALAKTRLAGDASRSAEGKTVKANADSRFDQDIQAVRDRTAALLQEQQAIGLSNVEQEKRRMALELEQQALADLREEARRKGETDLDSIKLSPDQVAAIDAVSQAYAEQADALKNAQEAFDNAKDLTKDVFGGFLEDIRQGTSATDALKSALDRLESKLLDLALNAAIEKLFQTLAGGGLGSLFGGGSSFGSGGIGHAATGGSISGPGTGTSDSIPTMLSNGEYVVRASSARQNRALLDAINYGAGRVIRMASGGPVGRAAPASSSKGRSDGIVINNYGRDQVQANVRDDGTTEVIIGTVQQGMSQGRFNPTMRGTFGVGNNRIRRGTV